MDSIIVRGGRALDGVIKISGAKNAALPIMTASLLTEETITLSNVPNLVDIKTMQDLLETLGAKCNWLAPSQMSLNSAQITSQVAPYDLVRKMRASIWVLGPLLARFGYAEVSMPGGCALGARLVDQHIAVMEALGAKTKTQNGYIIAKSNGRLMGCHYNFTKITVGATINGMLAACLAEGETILTNCASEPEIVDLANMLNKMGAKISGIGTSKLVIEGVKKLHSCSHKLISDRIEAGTYMCAVGITGGKIILDNIDYNLVENTILQLKQTGIEFQDLGNNRIEVKRLGKITASDLQTNPFPGFATDLQAQYMSLMTFAEGSSVISENIFENRYMHVSELCRMGANITINGHTAIVRGAEKLTGAEVMASDLRASSCLIIAGLNAEGSTKVRRIYHLDRGYENLVQKLQNCGADIERIQGDGV
ncbi:MAG: UDP-N-acetylglucosamine 1-carboxyvinyltransferase [Rickettsiaceae bacterium]|nr:UDP-N-acetylglucosamine 1-carboxyvinyltransferase [Rickettsiaceae bacterium]